MLYYSVRSYEHLEILALNLFEAILYY